MIKKIIPFAILSIYGSANLASAAEPKINLNLSPVVVTGTRIEQNSFDLPMSINSISGETIRDAQQQVHLSETAARIPGVVVNNRNHGAQELSISSRGFGPRSQFGVRGIRLYADGIPLTMPDGQGQTGTFNLDNASNIEFLRGPFSALYGNSSGGVVQLFTKNGGPETEVSIGATYGNWGTNRETVTYSGKTGEVDYLLNASRYETNGYRVNSGYKKEMLNAKIGIQLNEDTKLTLIVLDLDQPDVKDPGGLTLAEYKNNMRAARTNAVSRNLHKEISHTQAGVVLDHKITNNDALKVTTYYGTRDNLQFLFDNTASGYDRDFGGVDLRWSHKGEFINKPLNFTAGLNFDHMRDDRYRYSGTSVGRIISSSTLTRSEINKAYNFDQYLQGEWQANEKISVHAGLRNSRVTFDNTDKMQHAYDDKVSHSKTTPVAGIVFKVNPTFNLYANAGKGFETPTFVEQSYNDPTNPTSTNPNLKPSTSQNFEIGAKAFLTDNTLINLALFNVKTEKEIVVDRSDVVTVYKNAGDTERKGIELSVDSELGNNVKGYIAYTLLNAEFKDAFGSVKSGNKIPGTFSNRAYSELSWKHPSSGFFTAIEGIYSSKTYVNDVNTASADSYAIFNWRGGFSQSISNWKFSEFVRVDNITNKDYIVSTRANDTASRFYEPGLPANWTVGVNASYRF